MSMKFGGCAGLKVTFNYIYKYVEGSVVYFVPKAKKGILEPHAVKEAMLKFLSGNYITPIILYKDSYNAYFNEDELCSHADAIAYAKAYYEAQIAEMENALRNSCP